MTRRRQEPQAFRRLSPALLVSPALAAFLVLTAGGLVKFLALFLGPLLLCAALRRLPNWRRAAAADAAGGRGLLRSGCAGLCAVLGRLGHATELRRSWRAVHKLLAGGAPGRVGSAGRRESARPTVATMTAWGCCSSVACLGGLAGLACAGGCQRTCSLVAAMVLVSAATPGSSPGTCSGRWRCWRSSHGVRGRVIRPVLLYRDAQLPGRGVSAAGAWLGCRRRLERASLR